MRRVPVVRQGRTRKAYSVEFERFVCRLRDVHKECTIERFVQILKGETGYELSVTTVAKTLRKRDVWFNAKTLDTCKQRI